ncbi:virulence RhuM family protein [bacterium]|nr:virulence RhuM family protein [bacterium]
MKKENLKSSIIIYNTEDGGTSVSLYAKDGSVWMNQKQLAELFDTSKQNISLHIQNILEESELKENSVVKEYLTTGQDGKDYEVTFYSLEMILAIGFRVKSKRGTQFRIWANQNLKEYMIKGFVMDDERLKNPDGRPDYFDEILARIRDIRASEKRFYQKVRDLLSLSSDYNPSDKATQMFFAETQNKLLYSVTGKTAAELITKRASSKKSNMGLTSWKGKVVRKQDIYIAKNYLKEKEIDKLNRLVSIFLDVAEIRADNREVLTTNFWRESLDQILEFSEKEILKNKGEISNKEMQKIVVKIYNEFNTSRKIEEARLADEEDLLELKAVESKLKKMEEKDIE